MVHIAQVMCDVAAQLRTERHPPVQTTLEAITVAAVDAVPAAEDAGISFVGDRSQIQARAPTGERPRALDTLQDQLGEGPCYSAIREHETVHAPDVATEDRWPRFAAVASERGVGSMLTVRLHHTADSTLGALNLYASTPHAFDADSEAIARIFAVHAAVALAAAEREEHLEAALRSRDRIGQAKGILMERYKLTPEQAFAVLASISTGTNRKLRDIADEIATTGAISADPRDHRRSGQRPDTALTALDRPPQSRR
ncbi:GAF and ANTAR domain-containing protein [Geodermatophilus sp. URMC 61]|uniref:GAF and ANTAR domain-containing protein n=1 Tax=Geodermatophilus sp. URMC 61 TaxID=3423411 RepID=UPI00406D4EBC